jgi:hypothetical protein
MKTHGVLNRRCQKERGIRHKDDSQMMALLMYPTALSNDLVVSGTTKRKTFFGFCALSVLLLGYLLDRQIVIDQLRQRVAEVHQ